MSHFQRTIKKSVSFSGIGLHSGREIHVELRPAAKNTGVVFRRIDLQGTPTFQASPNAVLDTMLSTRVGIENGASVATIEHFMAALFGFGIDNIYVDIDNAEMPILDGSSAPFLLILDEAGVYELDAPKKLCIIKKTIEVLDEKNPNRFIRIEPSNTASISYVIDFKTLGKQGLTMAFSPMAFCQESSYARTFCLEEDVSRMYAMGLIKGGSINNAVVIGKEGNVLNAHGLRDALECVKHKILDCIGDLYLLGMPVIGHVIAHQAGHDLHTKLAKEILAQTRSSEVYVPVQSEKSKITKFLHPLPKSLLDIECNLVTLPIG